MVTDGEWMPFSGTTVAIYEVGCAIGALSCMVLGDKLGRRKTIFLAGCIVLVGVILQATPFQLAQLIVARVITGKTAAGPEKPSSPMRC
jgi:MFS family permease